MKTPNVNDLVQYRFMRAFNSLNDAKLLAEHESWNSAVNRLYYACFYAVNALLIHHGFEPKSHNGVKTIFFKEFIANEKISKEYGYLYSDLMDWRSQSNYADFIN